MQRSLAIAEKTLGKDSSDIVTILNNGADIYQGQRKYAKAQTLSTIQKNKDDLNYATSLNEKGLALYNKGKYTEAEVFLKNSLTILEKILGQNHTYVASSLNNLAMLYQYFGQF